MLFIISIYYMLPSAYIPPLSYLFIARHDTLLAMMISFFDYQKRRHDTMISPLRTKYFWFRRL